MKKFSVEGGRRRYPQITIMLDYNGAEKGCGSAEKGATMVVAVFADGADEYLARGKGFSIIWHSYVENDHLACCPSIEGQPPESPQQTRRYGPR